MPSCRKTMMVHLRLLKLVQTPLALAQVCRKSPITSSKECGRFVCIYNACTTRNVLFYLGFCKLYIVKITVKPRLVDWCRVQNCDQVLSGYALLSV